MISIGIYFLHIQTLNTVTAFLSLLVLHFRYATNQGFGVIRETGDHKKNIAFDLMSRERHRYNHQTKMRNIIAARHSKSFKTYALQAPVTSDPHTIDVTHGISNTVSYSTRYHNRTQPPPSSLERQLAATDAQQRGQVQTSAHVAPSVY